MEMEVFTVAGWQYGKFKIKDGKDAGLLKPYANIFVNQNMAGDMNENYHYCGSKSIKKRLLILPCFLRFSRAIRFIFTLIAMIVLLPFSLLSKVSHHLLLIAG